MTPYVGYQHLSDPGVVNDAQDMVCAGIKHYRDRLTAKAAWCYEAHWGDGLGHVEIEYDLMETKR